MAIQEYYHSQNHLDLIMSYAIITGITEKFS